MPVLEAGSPLLPGEQDPPRPLPVHLADLRSCLLRALGGWALATAAVYACFPSLLRLLVRPPVERLVFVSPLEPFVAQLKLSLAGGVLLSLPWLLLQAWRFVAPALRPPERRALLSLIPASYLLFLLGGALGLFVAGPLGLRFLLSYQSAVLVPYITLSSYIGYLSLLTLGLGVLFQIPVVLFALASLDLVRPSTLARYRKHVILAILVACAAITPSPDVVGQLLLAAPAYLLFEATLLAARLSRRSNDIMPPHDENAET